MFYIKTVHCVKTVRHEIIISAYVITCITLYLMISFCRHNDSIHSLLHFNVILWFIILLFNGIYFIPQLFIYVHNINWFHVQYHIKTSKATHSQQTANQNGCTIIICSCSRYIGRYDWLLMSKHNMAGRIHIIL